MSIIYDALKKLETSSVTDAKKKIGQDTKPKPKSYLLYALIICVVLFLANIFYGWLSPKPPLNTSGIARSLQVPVDKKEAVSSHGQQSKETSLLQTESQKAGPEQFILNGVFFSGTEGYALINNRIVKKGDKIDGATVAQIFIDEVDLELDGSTIKLSNSAK